MGRSVLGDTKNFHKAINDQSCKLKNSWRQNYLFHVCMLFFLTFSWGFSAWEFFVYSSVHSKVQENVYYYLEITLFQCRYSLIWVLNKSMLFGSNSLKMSVLLDINSAVLFTSDSLKSVSVSIVWYKIWNMFLTVGSNCLKVWILFNFFWPNILLLYALGSPTCIFNH